MKKLRTALILILCLFTAFSCAFSVSAESIKYKIEDLKMSIDLPDTMTVKTKENTQDMKEGIYLEAVEPESSLIISVSMIQDAETIKVDTFVDKPYSVLEDYKEQMENLGFSEGKDGNYGGVPFLDFSQKTTSESGLDIYTRHSTTLINGMSISIVSQSPGDNFTSDELSTIKACLDSIRFDTQSTPSAGSVIGKVVLWIVVILLILGILLLLLSYYMGKRNAQRKRDLAQERKKNADYDVLKKADIRSKQEASGLGGYKSSSDFFESGFDAEGKATATTSAPTTHSPSKTELAVKETKTAVTHMGYFFSNLKKEFKNNRSNKKSKGKKQGRKAVDYDIFNEK
ncbi:MAG: hypothetical protein IJA62_07705 [Ruminococcus sp.]|nr:hypothetical protein [Ruminococcus sp.]